MITEQHISQVIDSTAVGSDGGKLGNVGEVYLDDETGRPEWATVNTGLFGTKETFVPLAQADSPATSSGSPTRRRRSRTPRGSRTRTVTCRRRRRPSSTATTASAPRACRPRPASRRAPSAARTGTATAFSTTSRAAPSAMTPRGPTTDSAMTRSEEQLNVGTQRVEAGRARLRKYVVTENQTMTVPVSREEVRVEREPITDANVGNALDGPAISEEEHEVTLRAEQPVVAKEAVPVERVRLNKETVTEQQTVSDSVHKEQIEIDTDGANLRR
jgi:uncharacterized protein (TIGR02271 family)